MSPTVNPQMKLAGLILFLKLQVWFLLEFRPFYHEGEDKVFGKPNQYLFGSQKAGSAIKVPKIHLKYPFFTPYNRNCMESFAVDYR